MGVYDTFYINGECDKCGAIISEWQTKQLACLMVSYNVGEELEVCGLSVSHGIVGVYNSCPNCSAWNTANVIIENGVVSRLVRG